MSKNNFNKRHYDGLQLSNIPKKQKFDKIIEKGKILNDIDNINKKLEEIELCHLFSRYQNYTEVKKDLNSKKLYLQSIILSIQLNNN